MKLTFTALVVCVNSSFAGPPCTAGQWVDQGGDRGYSESECLDKLGQMISRGNVIKLCVSRDSVISGLTIEQEVWDR